MRQTRIWVNENKSIPWGTALAVVAAHTREEAHGIVMAINEFMREYYRLEDWVGTSVFTDSDKPHVIAETHYKE